MSKCILTLDQLRQMVKNKHIEHWYRALEQLLPDYDINTPHRVAHFVAQCAHESGSFAFIEENLNYRAASLMNTFKKYFPTQELAQQYERKPERIANRVYASRMGNGDEASGDGWRYRGRGLIQLTGKDQTALKDLLMVMIDNYAAYYVCAGRTQGWQEWYQEQKKIHEDSAK